MSLPTFPRLVLLAVCATLFACGGGSGGATGGGTIGIPPEPPAPPVAGIKLFAGDTGGPGSLDGTGSEARFYRPTGVAVDADGNSYVADEYNATIRKISPGGVVSTLAGKAREHDWIDGPGAAARFKDPVGVATDSASNVYVADGTAVRKISPAGVVSTIAGNGNEAGSNDGVGTGARFNTISRIAVDGLGNVLVLDMLTVRKIAPNGVVTSLAGKVGGNFYFIGRIINYTGKDGLGLEASFAYPRALTADSVGNVYVLEDRALRKVTPLGLVSTLAGVTRGDVAPPGSRSETDFSNPSGAVTDAAGNVYVADPGKSALLKITPAGAMSAVAGASALFAAPEGVEAGDYFDVAAALARDSSGNFLAAMPGLHVLRKLSPGGALSQLAGKAMTVGASDGAGVSSRFRMAGYYSTDGGGAAVDRSGNVYVADSGNDVIRKISPDGVVSTLAGRRGVKQTIDGTGAAAAFNMLKGVVVDGSGNLFVAEVNAIRKVTPQGVVTTVAGGPSASGDAALEFIGGIGIDPAGTLYVTDRSTVRKVTQDGKVSTIAGHKGEPYDVFYADGKGTAAVFGDPTGVAADGAGNVYVADTGNQLIRKIAPDGMVSTLAGSVGKQGALDGTGAAARFYYPMGLSIDTAGNLLVADTYNDLVRKVTPAGEVSTLIGQAGSHGIRLGTLPGSLSMPRAAVSSSAGVLFVVSENAVLKVQLP